MSYSVNSRLFSVASVTRSISGIPDPKGRSPGPNLQPAFSPFGICDHLRHLQLKMTDQGAGKTAPLRSDPFVSFRVFRGQRASRLSGSSFEF